MENTDFNKIATNVGLEITGALIISLLLRNGLLLDIPLIILTPLVWIPVHYLNVLNRKMQLKAEEKKTSSGK